MKLRHAPLLTIAAAALVAIGLAACGGSSNSSNDASAASSMPTGSASDTVSTKSISGTGTVLVDSNGAALYTNNQDSGMKVACTGSCAAIWVPLMAPSSGQPTSSDQAVQAKLGVVKARGGKPLYTFVQDSPGQVTGNGFSDQFNATSFTWTVASTGSVSSGSSGTSTSSGSSSSGGGGYGY